MHFKLTEYCDHSAPIVEEKNVEEKVPKRIARLAGWLS